ncbi:MAG: c-type cytochrome [Bacteroidia bacterium]|nr:c-type cytochrome [Bacteroidia bacterium]
MLDYIKNGSAQKAAGGQATASTAGGLGEKLFKQSCSSCHSIGTNKVVGPGLSGVESRWSDKALLHKWIHNSAEVLKSGDAYANKMFEENGKVPMTAFPDLKDSDIDAILDYIKNPPQAAGSNSAAGTAQAPQKETIVKDSTLSTLSMAMIVVFVVLIIILGSTRKSLTRLLVAKSGGEPEQEYGLCEATKMWISSHKTTVGIIILILFAWGGKISWYWMKDIGVYQGYMPEQPIKYSHKLHAGKNAIDCRYCHYNAFKGKVAGVPSANVCMNCHKYVQEGPVYGKTEIAKIYEALDYNPDKQTYGPNQKPIKWVRVHSLPDHVYFNHSQHVVAGQIECQKCHGPIQEMDTVRQFSPLTMGWCIECHRETEVKMAGNDYYNELHAKLKEQYKGEKITVAKMGGLDCSKCHY